MRLLSHLLFGGIILFTLTGCCGDCNQTNLGDFSLQTASLDWLSFGDGEPRRFRSNDGREMVFNTEVLSRVAIDRLTDCEDQGRCGLCCDEFTSEVAGFSMIASTEGIQVQFLLEKDFITNEVSQANGPVSDWLSITLNGVIRCEVFGLPDTTFTQNITLNNRSYDGVLTCEVLPDIAGPQTANVFRFHFRPFQGLVGFEETSGRIWNLQ